MIESDAEKLKEFQSTLLMRGATILNEILVTQALRFKTTLLMRGATSSERGGEARVQGFQSTLLMRGATSSSFESSL